MPTTGLSKNRPVEAWYNAADTADPNECVARYDYDGLFRRIEKTVTNQGTAIMPGSDDYWPITGIQIRVAPSGSQAWSLRTAVALRVESALRPRGRRPKESQK